MLHLHTRIPVAITRTYESFTHLKNRYCVIINVLGTGLRTGYPAVAKLTEFLLHGAHLPVLEVDLNQVIINKTDLPMITYEERMLRWKKATL